MNAEPIVDALLRTPAVLAVVPAASIALEQLAQGATAPALVYRTVSTAPALVTLCSPAATYSTRVQVNPLAPTVPAVLALHLLVRAAVESYTSRTVAGKRVISARWAGLGSLTKDDFTGLYTQPMDFVLVHE